MNVRKALLMYVLPAAGLLGLAGGAASVVLDQPDNPSEEPDRLPPVSPGDGAYIGGTGIVEASSENIAVGAPVGAVVEERFVGVGDDVDRGEPLFRLDTRVTRAAVEQRRAELEAAKAQLEQTRSEAPPARARVEQAEAQVATAQAQVADRRNRLDVAEKAGGARAVGAQEVASRQFAVEQAEASVKEAQARLAESRATLAQVADEGPTVQTAQAQVQQAQAALAQAEADDDQRTVTSPVDGRVLQADIRVGEFAPAGNEATLMVVGDVTPLHVRAQIDEFDIPRFERSARAYASPRGDATRRVEMAFVRPEPFVVPKRNLTGGTSERVDTRVLELIYRLPESASDLFVGQQVDVFIDAPEAEDAQ